MLSYYYSGVSVIWIFVPIVTMIFLSIPIGRRSWLPLGTWMRSLRFGWGSKLQISECSWRNSYCFVGRMSLLDSKSLRMIRSATLLMGTDTTVVLREHFVLFAITTMMMSACFHRFGHYFNSSIALIFGSNTAAFVRLDIPLHSGATLTIDWLIPSQISMD